MRSSERVARGLIDQVVSVASPTLAGQRLTSTDDQKGKAARTVVVLPNLGVFSRNKRAGEEDFRLICPRLTFAFRFIMPESELDQPLKVLAELGPRPKQLR